MNTSIIFAGIRRLATADSSSHAEQYEQAIRFLYQRINYEKTSEIPYRSEEFKLGRMRELVRRLGDPQNDIPLVHIAGTKGKGSTAELLSQIGQAAGYRIGKFTSPHLERLEERFSINGELCPEQQTVELIDLIRPIVHAMDQECVSGDKLTFFEITTAMAFLYFARQQVDLGIVEVGLGGRLDSTNVCQPRLAIITSISRDHVKTLGGELEQIAAEKGGIIKPGIPVVSGVQDPKARQVIGEIAANQNAKLWQLDRDFSVHPAAFPNQSTDALHSLDGQSIPFRQTFAFRTGGSQAVPELGPIELIMKGSHQVRNASLAIMAALLLRDEGFTLPDEAIRTGIAATNLAARIECIANRPTIIVDVAHNDASAKALAEVVTRHFPTGKRLMVYASSSDKQHEEILVPLLPVFDQVWLTRFQDNPRSQSPAQLHELATQLIAADNQPRCRLMPVSEIAELAFTEALAAVGPDDLLVVTGSFFIAAQFQKFWQSKIAATGLGTVIHLESNETTPSQGDGQTPP
ncbi:MAG: folylpolyglutamate synthase/dihydrofolate synthase family protein [Pirellulaceae bacterium]